jgi:hypothetical protein
MNKIHPNNQKKILNLKVLNLEIAKKCRFGNEIFMIFYCIN